jgi:hypothetical protein
MTQSTLIPASSFTTAGRPIFTLDTGGELLFPPAQLISAPSPASGRARWWEKANAFAPDWQKEVGSPCSLPALVLGLSQAQHETLCGDAWPGEFNWGAVQKRRPTSAELAVLAGLAPSPQNVALARRMLAAAVSTGAIPAPVGAALHVDSSPNLPPPHWYWMFFAAFGDDAAGADLFVREITVARPNCRAILQAATGAWAQDCESMSGGLYVTHYYEGVHSPATQAGKQANIDEYARSMLALCPGIAGALSGWTLGGTPTGAVVSSVKDVQHALNVLKVAGTPLDEDGSLGPKTDAAVRAFQASAGLSVDGNPGTSTKAALEAALDKAAGVTN